MPVASPILAAGGRLRGQLMEHAETLYLIAEIAAVLTGFVSLTVAYQSSLQGLWHAAAKIGQRYILVSSVLLLFGALLPIVLDALRMAPDLNWRISGGVYVVLSMWSRLDAGRVIGALPRDLRDRYFSVSLAITSGTSVGHAIIGLAIIAGPESWPRGGLYVAMLFLGLIMSLTIFASNVMPRKANILRRIEEEQGDSGE